MKKKRQATTIKEKRFVQEYLKTGNATEAAARVYDVKTRDSARNIGAQNVAKLCISDLLEKHGITNDTVFKTLAEAVKATKKSGK